MKKRTQWLIMLLAPLILALSPGENAPDFSAKNQDGKVVRLSDFKGKYLLIYFYPKDDTPGCTAEACAFRDEFSKLKAMKAEVLGVSRQDEKSHQEFRKKYKLPFDLLVDADGSLAKSFGVALMPLVGLTQRQSILISPAGKVVHFYGSVAPGKHVYEVMDDVKRDQGKGK